MRSASSKRPRSSWFDGSVSKYSVRSLLVVPFMLPPLLNTSMKCSPGPTFSEPLNIMCSNRCANPVRPLRSSREPTLKNVQFVMKDGQVFKQGGVVTPMAFFHAGPINGARIR